MTEAPPETAFICNFRIEVGEPVSPIPEDISEASEMSAEPAQAPATPPTKVASSTPEVPPPVAKKRKPPPNDPDRKGTDTRESVVSEQLAPTTPSPYMSRVSENVSAILTKECRLAQAEFAALEAAVTPNEMGDAVVDKSSEKICVRGGVKDVFKACLRPLLTDFFADMPTHARSSGGFHNSAADYYLSNARVLEGINPGAFTPLQQEEFKILRELDRVYRGVGRKDASFGRVDRKGKGTKDKAAEESEKARLFGLQEEVLNGVTREKLLQESAHPAIAAFSEADHIDDSLKGEFALYMSLDAESIYNTVVLVSTEAEVCAAKAESGKAKEVRRVRSGKAKRDEPKRKREAQPDPVYVAPC